MRAGFSRFSGAASLPSKRRQLIMKNLNDLLAGRDAAQHFLAERLLFDPRDEILRDLEIDIRFQQREPHLPQRVIDVRLADRPMTAKILEDVLKLIAELRKHNEFSERWPAGYSLLRCGSRRRSRAVRKARPTPQEPRPAPVSSILKVQCVSTFLPPDFALTMTVQVLSLSRCVT